MHWRKLAPMMAKLGLLTAADGDALGEYVSLWAYQQTNHRALSEEGLSIEDRMRLLRSITAISAQMMKLQVEFGMTPSSRTRIPVEASKPDDSLEAKFFGKKTTGM